MEDEKSISTTLQEMGIRTKKRVLAHLLLDNAFENNLLPDISRCDYLHGNLGTTTLQPLSGLPPFVDDIFVYGYVEEKHLFRAGGKPLCRNAKSIVARISTAATEAFERFLPTSIVHTVCGRGRIAATVSGIEYRTSNKNLSTWKEMYAQETPAAIFVAKVDASELSMEQVDGKIEMFARLLSAHSYGIYSIDYTQDFSGTLDRKRLVEYLRRMGLGEESMSNGQYGTILDNTHSVGDHVCTWMADDCRYKLYNKIVSNFEAGEVKNPMGGKLAEYVDCPNKHLRRTFLHPDVQRRGCTRIEISVYGRNFSTENANTIGKTLEFLSEEELFVVQPPRKLWENLSTLLDRCCLVACEENREIFLAWYCHTKTSRIVGIRVLGNSEKWEESILWTIAEFGFRRCPIFRIDVSLDPLEISPLRCYTKEGPTVLAESTMPTRVHLDAPNIEDYLPSSEHIEWIWRTKKVHKIGTEKSSQEIFPVATDRKTSFLSKRKRQKRIEDLEDALLGDQWAESTKAFHEELLERKKEILLQKEEERKAIEEEMEKYRKSNLATGRRLAKIDKLLETTRVGRLQTLQGKYKVLGYIGSKNEDPQWKARGKRVVLSSEEGIRQVWATEQILEILQIGKFQTNGKKHTAIVGEEIHVEIALGRIDKVHPPPGVLCQERYGDILLAEIRRQSKLRFGRPDPPRGKECVQALHMPPGEYQCWSYATTTFRGKERTILFLEEKCEQCVLEGCEKTHSTTPVWGHFLQEEMEKTHPHTPPLYCRIGKEKTTKSKKKDRIVHISLPNPQSMEP